MVGPAVGGSRWWGQTRSDGPGIVPTEGKGVMTELEQAIAAGLARELRAVYDHVDVYPPAPPREPDGMVEPIERRRLVVWHHGAAGTAILAMVVLHPTGLVLCLGPRHHQDWSRVETVPYNDAGAVERILEGIATVQV